MPPATSGKLKVTTPSDREIAMTRVFDAPRHLVYEAYTTPAFLKRWLGVFGGWEMTTCEVDLRVGGRYRWVWTGPGGVAMGITGTYKEIVPNERLVATEKFDEAWYEGDAVGTVTFVERAGKTTLTILVRYDSKTIRDTVLKTPMDQGVGASCDQLEAILAERV